MIFSQQCLLEIIDHHKFTDFTSYGLTCVNSLIPQIPQTLGDIKEKAMPQMTCIKYLIFIIIKFYQFEIEFGFLKLKGHEWVGPSKCVTGLQPMSCEWVMKLGYPRESLGGLSSFSWMYTSVAQSHPPFCSFPFTFWEQVFI